MAPDMPQAQQTNSPGQAPARAESPRIMAAVEHLKSILVPGETLEGFAVQRRAFALTRRRTLVAATSGRFIVMHRGFFGGFTPTDVRWQDVEEAHIQIGILSAAVAVKTLQRTDLASAGQQGAFFGATGLGKEQAEQVYRVCQAQSQAWREKRRVRDLDELRAKSGGLQFGQQGSSAMAPGLADGADPVARLKQAKDMLSGGLITDAEFEAIKARLVDRL
jgi:hypothetical protein